MISFNVSVLLPKLDAMDVGNELIKNVSIVPDKKNKFSNSLLFGIRETISISFWLYVFIKLFIFDIDNVVITKYFPTVSWLLDYKPIIILGIVSIFWIVTKNKKVFVWIAYILFFPFIVIFWKIPKAVYDLGSWSVAIAIINSFLSFFKSFKYNFIISSSFLIATTLILTQNNQVVLSIAIVAIFIIISITFINRFILVFKPSIIYQMHAKIIKMILSFTQKDGQIKNELKSLEIKQMSSAQLENWTSNLQMAVMTNRVCYLLSAKLKVYQKSRINIIFNVLSIVLMLVFTVFCFGLISLGFWKICPEAYTLKNIDHSFFSFLYYSFNAIHFTSVQEIVNVNNYSRGIYIIEQFFAILLGSIFVTLVFSTKSEREAADIDEVVKIIKENGDEVGRSIESEYNLSIENAILELQKLKSSMITIIYYSSKNIG